MTFPVPIEKEVTSIGKKEKITKATYYRLQFIDNARFMASSLSNHVNNLAEGIHTVKWKYRHDNKKCETCGFKYKNCEFCP